MKGMFLYAQNFKGHGLANWNVQNVRDFSYMFSYAEQFDAPIGFWQTNSATDMAAMFYGAISFNRELNWQTSGVTDFSKFLVRRETKRRVQVNFIRRSFLTLAYPETRSNKRTPSTAGSTLT